MPSAEVMLGPVDAIKLRSSMALFETVSAEAAQARPFARCLEAFFSGQRDEATRDRLLTP